MKIGSRLGMCLALLQAKTLNGQLYELFFCMNLRISGSFVTCDCRLTVFAGFMRIQVLAGGGGDADCKSSLGGICRSYVGWPKYLDKYTIWQGAYFTPVL